jgi:hypothetical protein
MAHFAKVVNNKVTEVIVVSNDDCGNGDFPSSEAIGQAFIASLGLTGEWLQTSYSGSFRNCYAGIDYDWFPDLGEYGEFALPPIPEPINDQDK